MTTKSSRPVKELVRPTVLYAAGWAGTQKLYLVDVYPPGDKTATKKLNDKIMALHAAGVTYKTMFLAEGAEPPRTLEG